MKAPVARAQSMLVVQLLCFLAARLVGQAAGGTVTTRPMKEPAARDPIVQLEAALSIGGAGDREHVFGRIADAAFLSTGGIVVLDALEAQVVVFDSLGKRLFSTGRAGDGPGEFRIPSVVAVTPEDSLFVWDARMRRVSVLDPLGSFARSFVLPAAWLVSSMKVRFDRDLVVAAFDLIDHTVLHLVRPDGTTKEGFGPRPSDTRIEAFAATLLGGYVDVRGDKLVYTNKSPYEVWIFSGTDAQVRCQGQTNWTTDPRAVVYSGTQSTRLDWKAYTHSARVLQLSDTIVLNIVFDPVHDRRFADVITTECQLLRRHALKSPMMFTDVRGSRILAVRNLDYPEVIVYNFRILEGN